MSTAGRSTVVFERDRRFGDPLFERDFTDLPFFVG